MSQKSDKINTQIKHILLLQKYSKYDDDEEWNKLLVDLMANFRDEIDLSEIEKNVNFHKLCSSISFEINSNFISTKQKSKNLQFLHILSK